jgi:hypothetical protein
MCQQKPRSIHICIPRTHKLIPHSLYVIFALPVVPSFHNGTPHNGTSDAESARKCSGVSLKKRNHFIFFNTTVPSATIKDQGPFHKSAVSRWSLTAEARVHAKVSTCRICGGTGFSPSPSVFPCQHHSIATPYSLMYHLGMVNGPISGSVPQRHSLTPS